MDLETFFLNDDFDHDPLRKRSCDHSRLVCKPAPHSNDLEAKVAFLLQTASGQPTGRFYGEHVETACISFFTLEYLLRLASTPNLKRFGGGMLTTVDLIAILPHYLQMILERFEDKDVHLYSGDIETVARVGKVKTVLVLSHSLQLQPAFVSAGGSGAEDHASDADLQDLEAGPPLYRPQGFWVHAETVLPAGRPESAAHVSPVPFCLSHNINTKKKMF